MSYLFIIVIGALTGYLIGQYINRSESGTAIDALAGAAGGVLAVVLVRTLGPGFASEYAISAIAAMIGATIALFGMRRVMKSKQVPIRAARRRV